jgi:hypothetical protein
MPENAIPKRTILNPIMLILLSLTILILGIGIGFALSNAMQTQPKNNATDNSVKATATPVIQKLTGFQGQFVSADLPANWEVVESSDFSKATVSEGQYQGLAVLWIKYANSNVVTFKAGYGIGDSGFCQQMFKFTDTDPVYTQTQINLNKEMDPTNVTNVVDLSNATYTQFTMLGNTVRRIDKTLYFKNDTANSFFNPSCGFAANYRGLTGVSFSTTTVGKPVKLNGYFVEVTIPASLTAVELQQLDTILQSLKAI